MLSMQIGMYGTAYYAARVRQVTKVAARVEGAAVPHFTEKEATLLFSVRRIRDLESSQSV